MINFPARPTAGVLQVDAGRTAVVKFRALLFVSSSAARSLAPEIIAGQAGRNEVKGALLRERAEDSNDDESPEDETAAIDEQQPLLSCEDTLRAALQEIAIAKAGGPAALRMKKCAESALANLV